ncbi:MAG: alcohol dehydrogenase catalytic domain-containing protein [bacterium]
MKALFVKPIAGRKQTDTSSNPTEAVAWTDFPLPEIPAGEALIKVRLAGICRTDLELAKGYLDFQGIPGHEFAGEVVAFNPQGCTVDYTSFLSQRVVGEINCGCGICKLCQSGLERHCLQRTVLGITDRNGAFAEYLTLPLRNLHVVPEAVSDQEAVFVEPLAAALEILEQVRIKPDSRGLVVGDGKLGILISRVLQLHGCSFQCVGGDPAKMSILEGWGIHTTHFRDYQPKHHDWVVEASGSPAGFVLAMNSMLPRGVLILKSTYHGSLTYDAAQHVIQEFTIIGSRCGPFAPALNLLQQKLIPTERLISRIFPFTEATQAFDFASQPENLKVLLDFRNES